MIPQENEPICLISYEVTRIRLGGAPDVRPSFWTRYREELELNRKTRYQNSHIWICRNQLAPLADRLEKVFFYRNGRLIEEKPTNRSN